MTHPTPGEPPAPQGAQPPPNPYLIEQAHAPSPTFVPPQAPPHAWTPGPAPQPSYAPYAIHGQAYVYAAPRTSTLAIVSMILSLSALLFVLPAVAGIVCGHIALAQIKRTGEGGKGMAIAGVVIGYVVIGFTLLAVVAPLLFVFAFFSTSGG